jgi:hypothetical protein
MMDDTPAPPILKQLLIRGKTLAAYCEQVEANSTLQDWIYFVDGIEDLVYQLKTLLPEYKSEDDESEDDESEDDESEDDESEDDESEDDESIEDESRGDPTKSNLIEDYEFDYYNPSDEELSNCPTELVDDEEFLSDHYRDGASEEIESNEDDDTEEDDESSTLDASQSTAVHKAWNQSDNSNDRSRHQSFITFLCLSNDFPPPHSSTHPIPMKFCPGLYRDLIKEFATDYSRIRRSVDHQPFSYKRSVYDVGEVFAMVAAGIQKDRICQSWTPNIMDYEIDHLFQVLLGVSPSNFRFGCEAPSKKYFAERLRTTLFGYLCECAVIPVNNSIEKMDVILQQTIKLFTQKNPNTPEDLIQFFGTPEPSLRGLLVERLNGFKKHFWKLLVDSAYITFLPPETIEAVEMRLVGATLREIGEKLKVTRERARQRLQAVEELDPIIGIIFKVSKTTPKAKIDPTASRQLRKLENQFILDPYSFFCTNSEATGDIQREPHETKMDHTNRLFSAYMTYAKPYLEHQDAIEYLLDVSTRTRKKLFWKLLQKQINDACSDFSPLFPEAFVQHKLAIEGIDLHVLEESIKFLGKLVQSPRIKASDLCRQSNLNAAIGKKVCLTFHDNILAESRRRASVALRILNYFTNGTPLTTLEASLLRTRYLRQLSIAETCHAMGISTSRLSMLDDRMRKSLPAITLLTPRRSNRK